MTNPTEPQATGDAIGRNLPWAVAAEQVRRTTDGLDWLAERQAAALSRVVETGLPDSSEEDWRYTSLAGYTDRLATYFADSRRPVAAAADSVRGHALSGAINLVDGICTTPQPASRPGLTIQSLRHLPPAMRTHAESLLKRSATSSPDKLVDVNTALLGDVLLIAAEKDSHQSTPVHVRLHGSGAPAFGQPRLLIDLAPGSRLTLIIEHTGDDGALVNAVHQVTLGRHSELNLIRVQTLPDDGMLTEACRIELAEAASVTVTSVDLGSRLSQQAITVLLAGEGATATVNGMFLADGQRHIDNRTRLEHQAPNTSSKETFRGIADGHGRGVFNGKIIVRREAPGSNAALTNRNLLLAATAEIDTRPELEIHVDDVRCSHGATTGQLDANALFYLRSRGLEPAVARQVLTSAFLRESLGGIEVAELRARLDSELQRRLGGPGHMPGEETGA